MSKQFFSRFSENRVEALSESKRNADSSSDVFEEIGTEASMDVQLNDLVKRSPMQIRDSSEYFVLPFWRRYNILIYFEITMCQFA